MTPDASPPGMNGGSGLNWYLPYDSNTSGKWSIHVAPLDGTPGASSDWPPLDSGRGTRPAQFAGEWTGGVRNFSGAGQCVFRPKANTRSGRSRTVIPAHAEHPFRAKPNTRNR